MCFAETSLCSSQQEVFAGQGDFFSLSSFFSPALSNLLFVSLSREVFFIIFLFPRGVCFLPKVCLIFFAHFFVQGGWVYDFFAISSREEFYFPKFLFFI
jgi:hypothetical protein